MLDPGDPHAELKSRLVTLEGSEGYRILCLLVQEKLSAAQRYLAVCDPADLTHAQAEVRAWGEVAGILRIEPHAATGGLSDYIAAALGPVRKHKADYPRLRF